MGLESSGMLWPFVCSWQDGWSCSGCCPGVSQGVRIGPPSGGMLGLVSQGLTFAEATGQPGCPDPASIRPNRVEGNINSGSPPAL